MISTKQTHNNNVAILIGPGFAENDVVYCLSQMRTAGLPTSLLGAAKQTTPGQHGLLVVPDYSLDELDSHIYFRLIIIPGSYECVTNLLMAPGFHKQVKEYGSLDGTNGRIAILTEAETALQQAKLFANASDKIWRQNNQPLETFCQELIRFAHDR
jgi:hypothetical protein